MTHILVVDDIPEMVETEKQLLQEMGLDYRVSMASNYDHALQLLSSEPFDLVILDLMLPDRSGVEVLDYIKQKFKVPVMIYSAYLEHMPPHLLLQKGADQVLAKPAPLYIFMNAIKNLIEPPQQEVILTLRGFNLRDIRKQVLASVVKKAVETANYNLEKASQSLGISRICLIRLIKQLQIPVV